MKPSIMFGVLFFIATRTFAADTIITNDSDAAQRERLFQRYLREMREFESSAPTNTDVSFLTNLDKPFIREDFEQMVVHPSFGYHWDEVPAPTMTGSNAMAAVDAFVATNGWNMQKDGCVFTVIASDKSKPIRGLPWTAIHDREFNAVTHDGILYVYFTGWHHDSDGVAYNPKTNSFPPAFAGFKHIGQHWYVWAQTDPPEKLVQEYEGQKK